MTPTFDEALELIISSKEWEIKQSLSGRLNLSKVIGEHKRLWITIEIRDTSDGSPVMPQMMRLGSDRKKLTVDKASGRLLRKPKAPAPKREVVII